MNPGQRISPSGFVLMAPSGRQGRITRQAIGLCTWCGKSVPSGRTTWCSDTCVMRYRMTQPDVLRELVEKRDRALCALCGCDTRRMRETILAHEKEHGAASAAAMLTQLGKQTTEQVVNHLLCDRRTVWDMDHTEPVSQGGDPFDMKNLRTLCYWCHKAETRGMY